MTQTHTEFLDLCAGDAVDGLSEMERAKLKRHLSECVLCTHALWDFREDALVLAMAAAKPPPPATKARILSAISNPVRTLPAPEPIPYRPEE